MSLGIIDGRCNIPDMVGTVHCANCLVGRGILKDGQRCPNGVRLETLDLASVPARKGRCLTCAERKALASK